jgi:hypothetical protein
MTNAGAEAALAAWEPAERFLCPHSSWFLPFPNVCGRSHSRNAVPFRNYRIGSLIDPPLSKLGGREMAILRLLQNSQLAAEDMARLVAAYEKTLRALRLVDRSDPITELVARKVIEISQSGVRDPAQISRLAVMALS